MRTLNQGSSPISLDFHPVQQTILLVGTNVGDIALWEVGSRERLVLRNFKVWDLSACSMPFQAALVKDPGVSVNRVIWSPDGALFGVAYSRDIVQIYSYHGGDEVRCQVSIPLIKERNFIDWKTLKACFKCFWRVLLIGDSGCRGEYYLAFISWSSLETT
ncbi:protein TPR3-like [Arachis stenosperma]|uniref:protein TPR3-like n=1 Tax=Arachis stenosperma TaxID=217475 RepID=UPI0025ACD4C6|nr:protein TPR3-like [Arachis stenosperma]